MKTKRKKLAELIASAQQWKAEKRLAALADGWALWECGESDELPPLEREGWNYAAEYYEIWRDAAIQEYDQRQR